MRAEAAISAFVEQFDAPVFPCGKDAKTPITRNGFKDATRDLGQIKKWAQEHPECNWAMPTGRPSGFVVIDVDERPEYSGSKSLHELEDAHGKLPVTATVRTPSGGTHRWFRMNGFAIGNSASKLAPGLDVRGEGGYVVIPPSKIFDRPYSWDTSADPGDIGFAEMPAWLADRAAKRSEQKSERTNDGGSDKIPGGKRNDTLASMAGKMRRIGMSAAAIEAALLKENATRCDPPLPPDEVRKIAESYGRYQPGAADIGIPDWPEPIDLEKLSALDPQKPQFIIPDWLPAGYATLISGHGGLGKSQIALHLLVCIASGLPFFGLPVERRRVLYLSCEDRVAVLHWRLKRISRHLGITDEAMANLHRDGWLKILDLVGHQVVLFERDPRTGNTFTAAFGTLAERVRALQAELIVVDGISDTYSGNGGSKAEVKRYVNALVSLIHPDRGAVLLIGHIDKKSAKDGAGSEGYDGTTGWHNAARARWYLRPEKEPTKNEQAEQNGTRILELQKSNFGRSNQSIRVVWEPADHVFVGTLLEPPSYLERNIRDRGERNAILAAFRACASAGVYVPAATTGRRTALHVLQAQPEFPHSLTVDSKPERDRFWRHIEELRAMREIREASIASADRHKVRTLEALTPGAAGNAGNAK